MKVNLIRCSKSLLITLTLICLTFSSVVYAEQVGVKAIAETAIAIDVIVNIDKDSRAITLKSEDDGSEWVFNAGPEVRNFDQLKRGDLVITEYYSAFAIALEPKGSNLEERISGPEIDRAEPGEKPGVQYTDATYILARITEVNLERGTVTIEGVEGSLTTAVSSELDLSAVEVGQEVEVLYIESMAISVVPAPKVSGTLEMEITSVAIGIGLEWGGGTLTMYDDTSHDFKIHGLTVLDVGVSAVKATGEVYHLVEAKDLEGTFISGEAGAVLVAGGSVLTMKNHNGVVVKLKTSQKGARLTLAAEGMKFKLK